MCTLQSKYQREAERFLTEATKLITLAARTNYMHQTRERGVESYKAVRETDEAMERLLNLLRDAARDEARSAYRAWQSGIPMMTTCPSCGGLGSDPNDPEIARGGAPHAECLTCEGTGEVGADTAPVM